ncbi:MAG TPA: hypothetical protein VMS60_16010 [Solirubrobacterales bacterium]|nr:hypothetical protein [Solirubrobacterales bacterium]
MSLGPKKRTRPLAVLAVALAVAGFSATAALAVDRIDPSFGQGGVAIVPQPDDARSRVVGIAGLAQAPDGKLAAVLSGFANIAYFGAARFNPDGSLDTSFGRQGYTAKFDAVLPDSLAEAVTQAETLAVQPDGMVVVGGTLEERSGAGGARTFAPVMVRYGLDGAPDPSFGLAGAVAPAPRFAREDTLYGIAVAADGRIVTVGSRNEHERKYHYGLVTAYAPDGQIDRNFGHRGRVFIASFPSSEFSTTILSDVEILPSGKILVAGYRSDRLLLARLRPNGRLDSSFGGGDGQVSLQLRGRSAFIGDWSASLAIQADGRIVAQGAVRGDERDFPAVARFRADGTLDRSFGRDGMVAPDALRGIPDVHGVAVEGDGRIVVVGARAGEFRALRFLPDGTLDRRFGLDGLQQIGLDGAAGAGAAFTQPDGRVVAGGWLARKIGTGVESESQLVLTRYLPGD